MIATERALAARLADNLDVYEAAEGPLPGLDDHRREPLIGQIVASTRRNVYMTRDLTRHAMDPSDERFDPLKAAILHDSDGEIEEAFWMMFLYTHFGNNLRGGWEFARKVYGALGVDPVWTWERVSQRTDEFRDWLDEHHRALSDGPGGFGNHRKRETLAGRSPNGTGAAVASYVNWAGPLHSQQARFDEAVEQAGGDPARSFDLLDKSLLTVRRFGRLARFDYLSTIGKIGLADIAPGKVYFKNSSGPMRGAKLLFGPTSVRPAADYYEAKAAILASHLSVGYDVIEDSLCNWQKSPDRFKRFLG